MNRILVIVSIAALASSPAYAESLAAIVTAKAGADLPETLAVTGVHLARSLDGVDMSPEQVAVEWSTTPRAGRSSVKVRLRGRRARTVFVPVTLTKVIDVAVATRDLAVGDRVTTADVRRERRPVAVGSNVAAVVGQQVTEAIHAGEALDSSRLVLPPLVARGTEVTVRVRRGAVQVDARGRLEIATRPGSTARVRLDANQAPIEGVLMTPSLVTIGGGS